MSTNYGIIKNGLPAETQSGLRFLETFGSAAEVQLNGGTINGTPTINNGILCNGTTDYAKYTFDRELSGDFDLSFKVTAANLGTTIFCLGTSTSISAAAIDGVAFYLGTSGTKWTVVIGDGTNVAKAVYNTNAVAGQEYYIAIKWNNTTKTIRLYIDGVLIETTTNNSIGDININSDFYVGKIATNYFNGTIKELRLFTEELDVSDTVAYSNNTIFNYLKDAELILPMRLEQHDPSGLSNTEEIVDGDMEDAGTTAWLIVYS